MELKYIVLPLKILGLIVLAVFARIFYDNNKLEEAKKDIKKIKLAFVFTKAVMGTLVFLLTFFTVSHFFSEFDENMRLILSSFASSIAKEIFDTAITVPSAIKNYIFDKLGAKKSKIEFNKDKEDEDYEIN